MERARLVSGVLVVFEGIDGAGKTTQAAALAQRLSGLGIDVVTSKEPTNGPWGTKLRASAQTGRLPPDEELAAFVADRKEHVSSLIQPALQAGKVVIVDRYYYSTAAYQGVRGMDPDEIVRENETFAPRPHLLVILDVPPKVGVERIRTRGDEANLFEREADLEKSGAIFGAMRGDHVLHVDGAKSVSEVSLAIFQALYQGALFRATCRKSHYKGECEPEFCSFAIAKECPFPAFGRALR